MNNNKKIFICCTEQSGENIVFNICQKLKKYNYQIDGVCGKSSEAYFTNKYYDISLFKSLGLAEIIFSIPKFIKIINNAKNKKKGCVSELTPKPKTCIYGKKIKKTNVISKNNKIFSFKNFELKYIFNSSSKKFKNYKKIKIN